MKYKTAELDGALLDAAVAKAEGWTRDERDPDGWWSPNGRIASSITEQGIASGYGFHPAHFWSDGGPIIERERITLGAPGFMKSGLWEAFIEPILDVRRDDIVGRFEGYGPTPLIAAMRCYVASKYGETIELP